MSAIPASATHRAAASGTAAVNTVGRSAVGGAGDGPAFALMLDDAGANSAGPPILALKDESTLTPGSSSDAMIDAKLGGTAAGAVQDGIAIASLLAEAAAVAAPTVSDARPPIDVSALLQNIAVATANPASPASIGAAPADAAIAVDGAETDTARNGLAPSLNLLPSEARTKGDAKNGDAETGSLVALRAAGQNNADASWAIGNGTSGGANSASGISANDLSAGVISRTSNQQLREAAPGLTADSATPGADVAGAAAIGHASMAQVERAAAPVIAQVRALLGSPGFTEEAATRIHWIASQGIDHASIRVTPADMGPIEIRIALRDSEVLIAFAVTRPEAAAAIENALPRLKEMLEASGMNLSNASVDSDTPGRETARRDDRADQQFSPQRRSAGGSYGLAEMAADPLPPTVFGSSRLIDLFA